MSVARRGPFVMTTEAELDQAVADYRSGRGRLSAGAAQGSGARHTLVVLAP